MLINASYIDCIGGDTSINPDAKKGLVARNGTVSGNTVYNAHSSYDKVDGFGDAAGIYVDGGLNIVVTDNISHNNDFGLEVGAENAGVTVSGITVSDNLIYGNSKVGIGFGGYDNTVGHVTNCYFVSNTLYNNDTALASIDSDIAGQLVIQDASNCVVANNIFVRGRRRGPARRASRHHGQEHSARLQPVLHACRQHGRSLCLRLEQRGLQQF